jgi:methyl-coenzyme M reductase alpha subunit
MATEKTQKMFLDAMKKKFAEDPTSNKTAYKREGYIQSKDKREFQEWGATSTCTLAV